jgi:hypothetical protein
MFAIVVNVVGIISVEVGSTVRVCVMVGNGVNVLVGFGVADCAQAVNINPKMQIITISFFIHFPQ